jgi:hypothetical protein
MISCSIRQNRKNTDGLSNKLLECHKIKNGAESSGSAFFINRVLISGTKV